MKLTGFARRKTSSPGSFTFTSANVERRMSTSLIGEPVERSAAFICLISMYVQIEDNKITATRRGCEYELVRIKSSAWFKLRQTRMPAWGSFTVTVTAVTYFELQVEAWSCGSHGQPMSVCSNLEGTASALCNLCSYVNYTNFLKTGRTRKMPPVAHLLIPTGTGK